MNAIVVGRRSFSSVKGVWEATSDRDGQTRLVDTFNRKLMYPRAIETEGRRRRNEINAVENKYENKDFFRN